MQFTASTYKSAIAVAKEVEAFAVNAFIDYPSTLTYSIVLKRRSLRIRLEKRLVQRNFARKGWRLWRW